MAQNANIDVANNPNELLVIPKWLNAEYFEEILKDDVPNYVSVKNFRPIAATAPGENYTSIMVRIIIDVELSDGKEQQISYILKTELETGESRKILADMCLFSKEILMYRIHVSRYAKLYEMAGWHIKLTPRSIKLEETSERKVLIMEDLKRRNFQNVDRLKGMDFEHVRCALHKIAEFHAASAVSYQLYGAFESLFDKTAISVENRNLFESLWLMRRPQYVKAMRTWGLDNVEHFIELQSNVKQQFDAALKLTTADPNEFNVLNHGDCWVNNFMFNYKENGEINETLLVDLQLCKWGSPAQDLWYFITSSIALDIKVKEFDNFVRIYHERLVECLKALKYGKRIPSLKELHIMMLKYGYWSVLTASNVLVAVLYPSDKDANMNNMLGTGPEAEEFRYKTFKNTYYAKAMCQLLPFLENKGILSP